MGAAAAWTKWCKELLTGFLRSGELELRWPSDGEVKANYFQIPNLRWKILAVRTLHAENDRRKDKAGKKWPLFAQIKTCCVEIVRERENLVIQKIFHQNGLILVFEAAVAVWKIFHKKCSDLLCSSKG